MASRKPVLTKKDYAISVLRSYYLQNVQNYGNMQGTGVLKSIWPELHKIYQDDEQEFKRVAISNLEFYNTNPQPYPFVTSIMLAMYDSGQSENDVQAIKMALMGPLAGIGDALSQFALAPLFSTIFASLALQGIIYAPLMFFACLFGITFGVRCLMGYLGWKVGTSIIDTLSDKMAVIADIASTIGLTVIAGLSVSFVKVNLGLKYSAVIKGKTQLVTVQAFLDKIMPYLLPVLLIYFVYWLITKKKWTVYKIILLLLVLGIALSAMGILVP
ncbi:MULTISPECIES: PTS system mannose/fructose/sorbose family transporter subunit IID [Lactobacillus]|uniref:PTS system mannose/fructose/sorbose family transporter subunit IID n=1 Tax=Lactobacillus TaxID=1578 RepID=UPI00051385E9|nr:MULTISPECIES: PTS system mannose/fructose/sorbose family transporter subunit IID [unclassified Lactobacillus]KGG53706.1 PTS system, hyaluronate-oligosaccharide-specific IID component [Lactobacillus sp. wkB10]MBI0122008.1 PTS system mannose/fructose/sorbose family transporter subunit IID [Lactobacillus sp. M0398]MBI0123884.1 PTS system mannose/fructose/sorbose family transporter subunit IID [Lactobacillus sp. W8174]MBI0136052.1 PTS system mannose/fructose/sorbose family transporter subunit II